MNDEIAKRMKKYNRMQKNRQRIEKHLDHMIIISLLYCTLIGIHSLGLKGIALVLCASVIVDIVISLLQHIYRRLKSKFYQTKGGMKNDI